MGLPPLRAGDLRHTVTLRRSVDTPDGMGGYTSQWQDIARLPAEVIGQDGRESVMAQALQGISVYRVRIRYRADIQPSDQLRYGAIDINIRSASDPTGRREQLVIVADNASVQAG